VSLRAPSLVGLLAQLQQHGLTYAQLLEMVMACRAGHSGTVVFHLARGHIRTVEVPVRTPTRLRHD